MTIIIAIIITPSHYYLRKTNQQQYTPGIYTYKRAVWLLPTFDPNLAVANGKHAVFLEECI
jgi:hypothetical protein